MNQQQGNFGVEVVETQGVVTAARPPYRRLWRFSVLVTLLTALTPLFILTAIQYRQDHQAAQAESNFTVSQLLSNTRRTLEYVVNERQSVLALTVGSRPYRELARDETLSLILRDLNRSFGGFVDLGLIDSDGNQAYYAGPYDLKGKNYRDQAWFQQVYLHGDYVSEVFLGHRNSPHFVISFRHDREDTGYFILRATLDMELLNNQMYSLQLERNTDAFIINMRGVLQTASTFYGDVLDSTAIVIPPHSRVGERISAREEGDLWITEGYAQIEGTPFLLMVIGRRPHHFTDWVVSRSDLIWLLGLSAALILIAVFYSHRRMIRYLRQADLRRAKILHNVEYTNKMATIGRLAAGVAHEINNPLAIISEKSGLLRDMAVYKENFSEKDKVLSIVESISKSVERCSRVTHRLLGFAKRMDVKREKIILPNLLKEVVGFQQTEVAHRNLQIDYSFSEELPPIENDRGLLQQVLLNIINNAFAAVEDGGRIQLSANSPNSNEVVVRITDNGTGIGHEDLKHIFEPFFSTKGQAGTGLGLSITKDLVEKLGGLIEVESEIGKGTTFIINLPTEKID